MIYTTKNKLAEVLNIHRVTVARKIKDGEIKEVYNNKGKRVGYVIVIEFIQYLVN